MLGILSFKIVSVLMIFKRQQVVGINGEVIPLTHEDNLLMSSKVPAWKNQGSGEDTIPQTGIRNIRNTMQKHEEETLGLERWLRSQQHCYSSRGPRFNTQNLCDDSKTSVTPVPVHLIPSFVHHRYQVIHRHTHPSIQIKYPYTK